jgi:peptide/nickel transport system substrate-binding protein
MTERTEKVVVDGVSSTSRRDILKAVGPAGAMLGLAGCLGGDGGSGDGGGDGGSSGDAGGGSGSDDGADTDTEASGSPTRGGVFEAGMNVGVLTLDGRSVTSLQSMQVMYNIYSKLLDYELVDDQLRLVGDLATAWEFEDETTLRFDLAEEATFHNGEPVTASDVQYTFETMQSKAEYTANLLFSQQVSVEARDRKTAVFRTGDTPFASIESNVGFVVGIVNEEADEAGDMSTEPVGSGPFRLAEWVQGDHVHLERFEDYWKTDDEGTQLPYLEEVRLNIYPDDAVKLRGLQQEELHWIDVVPSKDVESVRDDDALRTSETGPGGFMGIFQFNTEEPPFDDARVRKAMLHAVDWEAYRQVVFRGTALNTNNQPLAPETGWNIEELDDPFEGQDVERAMELLDEAGVDPEQVSFTNYVNQGLERDIKAYEVLQAQLEDTLGMSQDLRLVDKSTVFEKTNNLEFGYSAGAFDGMYDPDQVLTVNLQEGAFFNYGNFANDEINRLLEEGRQTNDREERYETYRRIYEINNEEAGKYYPYWQNLTSAFLPSVRNFNYPYDTCWYFERVWLDE